MENIAIIIASIVSAIGGVIAVWVKNKFEYNKKECIQEIASSGVNVYKALDFILNETDAARAYVFEFHNGEKFFSGKGQQKFSCTYEKVRAGVSAECLNSQNHRISNYNEYIHTLICDGKYYSTDTSSIKDSALSSILQNKGVHSFYNVPIKTLNGKIIGILGIDYICPIEEFMFNADSPDPEVFMKRQARIISGYLI